MKTRTWLRELLLIVVAALMLAPLAFLVLTAFKPEREVLNFQAVLPEDWTVANFRRVLGTPEEIPIGRWFFNSVFIAGATTTLVLAISATSAYALVRLRPAGSGPLFALIVGTMMIPGQVLLVPLYFILNALGWIDTPMALVFPAGASAFGTFLLAQFFRSIPRELEEAAIIDGCGRWGVFWNVIVPLGRPALATLGIFTFVGSWNNLLGPLVFLESIDQYTLPVGVALFQSSYVTEFGLTFAASVLSTLPVVIVFVLFQRHIIQSVAMSGIK